jgi:hypothetical protein
MVRRIGCGGKDESFEGWSRFLLNIWSSSRSGVGVILFEELGGVEVFVINP